MIEGTKVKVVACTSGHEFSIGEVVTRELSEYDGEMNSLGFRSEHWGVWYMKPHEYEILPFGGITREQMKSVILDLLDGYWTWYEIQHVTGESEERCKEILAIACRLRDEA